MYVGFGLSGSCSVWSRTPSPKRPVARAQPDRVVERLHHEQDQRARRPLAGEQRLAPLARVPEHLLDEPHRAREPRARADEDGEEKAHRAAAAAVGDGLDMGVRVGVDRAGDRHPLREVARLVVVGDGEDRLAVGAHEVAEPVRDAGEGAARAAVLEQLVGAERTGGEHDPLRGEGVALLADPGARALGEHVVAVAPVGRVDRRDVHDHPVGEDAHAAPLGEVEVVLHERVLGAVAAADHALAALDAAGPVRALAAEVGVLDGLARLAEVHADVRLRMGVLDAQLAAQLAQHAVALVVERDARDAEHPLGGVVVRGERLLPVVERGPLRVLEEPLRRPVEGVRVAEAAAPDAAAGQDRDVLENRHPEDPAQPEPRRPEVAAAVPGRVRELVVLEPAPALEHRDAVALLGEAERGHAAAEPGPDHDPVVVVRGGLHGGQAYCGYT